jgi:hypothetical protein
MTNGCSVTRYALPRRGAQNGRITQGGRKVATRVMVLSTVMGEDTCGRQACHLEPIGPPMSWTTRW